MNMSVFKNHFLLTCLFLCSHDYILLTPIFKMLNAEKSEENKTVLKSHIICLMLWVCIMLFKIEVRYYTSLVLELWSCKYKYVHSCEYVCYLHIIISLKNLIYLLVSSVFPGLLLFSSDVTSSSLMSVR